MEAQMLTPQPVSNKQGIGGWLIFIGLRLVVGLIMNIVGIAGMAVNKASGMYYFYGTDVLMGVITALGAVVLVFYFLRKKPFVYLYIILAALSIFSNFLAQNGVMAVSYTHLDVYKRQRLSTATGSWSSRP